MFGSGGHDLTSDHNNIMIMSQLIGSAFQWTTQNVVSNYYHSSMKALRTTGGHGGHVLAAPHDVGVVDPAQLFNLGLLGLHHGPQGLQNLGSIPLVQAERQSVC
eukprot:scaffold173703_cov37-Prasinocladus_malaysianus.AAC.2